MIDQAASVLVKLRNKSLESGRSYQLCMQLFCQEELLRRIASSPYADKFVLKGGMFIYVLTEFSSRVTVDVDFLVQDNRLNRNEFLNVVEEILNISTGNNFIIFTITNIRPIAVNEKSAGVGVSLIAKIKNTKTYLSIDFGFDDVITPETLKLVLPTQLSGYDSPSILAYSIETTIAEKLDAILKLMEFSSRMKDYYDIFYLANSFNFNGEILSQAISDTFNNRKRSYTYEQFQILLTMGESTDMKLRWQAFCRKTKVLVDFDQVVLMIDHFLSPLLQAVLFGEVFSGYWISGCQLWTTSSDPVVVVKNILK
jgi:predicted nucleotidyltransferase component of viral defense system